MINTSEFLKRGLHNLESRGWIQGRLTGEDGHCSVGAVQEVALTFLRCRDGSFGAAVHRVDCAVAYLSVVVGGHVPTWNDKPERTYEDVVMAYKQAIELAEAHEAQAAV